MVTEGQRGTKQENAINLFLDKRSFALYIDYSSRRVLTFCRFYTYPTFHALLTYKSYYAFGVINTSVH